jgi:hypothetical protein
MPFGKFIGHVVCKDRVMVDPANIVAIVNEEAPTNFHMLQFTPGQTRYYRRFIKGYTTIITPMEYSLRKKKYFF